MSWWSKCATQLAATCRGCCRSSRRCKAIRRWGSWVGEQELTLEKLPAFIDLLHGKLLLAHGGRNAVEEAFLRDRLRSMLPAAKARAQRLIADLRQIAEDAERLVREMDFRYLYDRRRKLLSIGSDAETGKVHAACYDLLASEARIAAFLAVANDHIPQESWFQLGRSQTVDSGHATLISWTGTMFEYLLPAVWMRWYPETLLQRSMEAAVGIQRAYGAEHRVPWGVSECAFAVQDEERRVRLSRVRRARAGGAAGRRAHGGRAVCNYAGAGFRSRSGDQESALDEPEGISGALRLLRGDRFQRGRATAGASRLPWCGSGWCITRA